MSEEPVMTPTRLFHADWVKIPLNREIDNDSDEIFCWSPEPTRNERDKRMYVLIQHRPTRVYYVVVRDGAEQLKQIWKVVEQPGGDEC